MRARIVGALVALAVVPTLVLGFAVITDVRHRLRVGAIERLAFDTRNRVRAIEEFLAAVRLDLRYLAGLKEVERLAEAAAALAGAAPQGEVVAAELTSCRIATERALLAFSTGKRAFYQVRYLDDAGREIVRMDVDQGVARVVADAELQEKGERYYVREGLRRGLGEIYVSPIDLNVEHGRLEDPPHSVMRFVTRVAGSGRVPRGLLVINVDAEYLFSLLGELAPLGEAWLLDHQGRYLGYAGTRVDGARHFGLAAGRSLTDDHSAAVGQSLLAPDAPSPRVAVSGDAFLCATPVWVGSDGRPDRSFWVLVGQPRQPIEEAPRSTSLLLCVVVAVVALIAAAAGTLLANRLHRLTVRLDEARNQLAMWNTHLNDEVARRTGELRVMHEGLARVDKLASMGQLTAGVLHEIGNPLAAIKTRIQTEQEEEHPDWPRLTHELLGEVNRLSTFLRGFARMARLPLPSIQSVDARQLVDSVCSLLGPELLRRGIRVEVITRGQLPPLQADPDQMRQVLINLILNAAAAAPRSGRIQVELSSTDGNPADGADAHLLIAVSDDGDGIAKEHMERIFDPFFTTRPGGSGLGLAASRRILRDHGGRIEVCSEAGVGTTMTLWLPRNPRRTEPST